MAINDRITANSRQPQAGRSPARLFAIRLWTEEGVDGPECRGNAKDVVTGAFRGFQDWTDLTDFLLAQLSADEPFSLKRLREGLR